MRKEKTLLFLGIWVFILPFLGFPDFSRKILFMITGVCIVYLAYLFYVEAKSRMPKEHTMQSFVDNIGSGE